MLQDGKPLSCLAPAADVVGTRVMVLTTQPNLVSFCVRILKDEGISAFYKGTTPLGCTLDLHPEAC